MFKEFRDFIAKGNAIDLAVGVIIGGAFSAVVTALVNYLIMPLIAAVFGKPDFSSLWVFTINNAQFRIGSIVTALVNFLLIAITLFVFIILPMNRLKKMQEKSHPADDVPVPTEREVLQSIEKLLQGTTEPRSTGAHAAGDTTPEA